MSGGHFDYVQYRIDSLSDELDSLIRSNDSQPEFIAILNRAKMLSKELRVLVHGIDYYVSDDYNWNSMVAYLKENGVNIEEK